MAAARVRHNSESFGFFHKSIRSNRQHTSDTIYGAEAANDTLAWSEIIVFAILISDLFKNWAKSPSPVLLRLPLETFSEDRRVGRRRLLEVRFRFGPLADDTRRAREDIHPRRGTGPIYSLNF